MFTIDVEPDWGVAGCRSVQETLPRLCRLLRERGVRGTFFVVASLLEACGDVLQELTPCHELASHGLTHRPLSTMTEDEVLEELSTSRERLSAATGERVIGFRASYLRRPRRWFDLLARAGYEYDCSVGAVYPSPRNIRPSRWRIERHGHVTEIPTTSMGTGWIPFSLTYLRLLSPLGERLVSDRAATFYLHLHELASPSLAKVLPMPWRALLRRRAGEPAWEILGRVLDRFGDRAVTCSEFLSLADIAGVQSER